MKPRSISGALITIGLALTYFGVGTAFAVEEVTLTESTVTAERDNNGAVTATVNVTNNGEEKPLDPPAAAAGDSKCTVQVDPVTLPPRQGTTIKLTLGSECFPDTGSKMTEVKFDLDEDGAGIPEVTIKSPVRSQSPWSALIVGGSLAAVLGAAMYGWVRHRYKVIQNQKVPTEGDDKYAEYAEKRQAAYRKVQDLVRARWWKVRPSGADLEWVPLPPRSYGLHDTVKGLEATWSLKDSWMANLTAVISAVVAVGTSDQLITAVNTDKPKGPLGVMAIAGLIGVALVATSSTLVKLIGKPANEVTVHGLLIANALLFATAVFETVAVIIAGGYALDAWGKWVPSLLLGALGAGLILLAWRYLGEKLEQTLRKGVPASGVPAIALGDFDTWVVSDAENAQRGGIDKRNLLEQRVKTALHKWLDTTTQATTQIGSQWEETGMVEGVEQWGPGPDPAPGADKSRVPGTAGGPGLQ